MAYMDLHNYDWQLIFWITICSEFIKSWSRLIGTAVFVPFVDPLAPFFPFLSRRSIRSASILNMDIHNNEASVIKNI